MDDTTNLKLPYIMSAQAQKHVTHNEALRALDAVVQLSVVDRMHAAPPASAAEGGRYIVAAPASGAWSGQAGRIAAYQDGAWAFHAPVAGWLAWSQADAALLVWDGSAWQPVTTAGANHADMFGINTVADTTNRLAAKSDAVLLSHDDVTPGSGDMRIKVNKASSAKTASHLFQTGYSGRAEVGLAGDDDLHFKVSADGTSWKDALVVDKSTGAVRMPFTPNTSGVPTTITPPAGTAARVLSFDPTPLWSGAPQFTFALSTAAGANSGAPATDTYGPAASSPNLVASFGWNFDLNGTRLDTSKPAWGFALEYNYFPAPGTRPYIRSVEGHWKLQDASGTEHRPITMVLPWDGGSNSRVQIAAEAISLANDSGGVRTEIADNPAMGAGQHIKLKSDSFSFATPNGTEKVLFDFASNKIKLGASFSFASEVNGAVFCQQKNAAGTGYVNLPYIDGSDRVVLGPCVASGSPIGAKCFSFTGAGLGSFDSVQYINGSGSFTADVMGTTTILNSSVAVWDYLVNGTTGHAGTWYQTNAGGGDPFVRFYVNGGGSFSAGVDNSDSDKFKISAGTSLGTNDRITIDASTVAFGLPAKLASNTAGTLPSASAAGAGSLAYVTDASGGPTIACSNGTSWKVAAVLGATVS